MQVFVCTEHVTMILAQDVLCGGCGESSLFFSLFFFFFFFSLSKCYIAVHSAKTHRTVKMSLADGEWYSQ